MTSFIGVMGVGRCGSSAVAGMLHAGGVPMGDNLIGPHARFNAKGHFEDPEWHWLNRLVAHRLADKPEIRNETLQRYPRFAEDEWSDAELFDRYRAAIAAHVREPAWGMKCIMLGYIWPYVVPAFAGMDVRLIVVEREREAIVRSRMEHSQLARPEAETLVDALQNGITETVRRHYGPHLTLHYEFVVRDPRSVASLLKNFTGLESFDEGAAAAQIDPAMNHHGMVLV